MKALKVLFLFVSSNEVTLSFTKGVEFEGILFLFFLFELSLDKLFYGFTIAFESVRNLFLPFLVLFLKW